jgi:hypothetical protein
MIFGKDRGTEGTWIRFHRLHYDFRYETQARSIGSGRGRAMGVARDRPF